MTTHVIVWEEPPGEDPSKLAEVTTELRARSAEWAKIASNETMSFNRWWGPLLSDQEFEVRVISQPTAPGFVDVYARYLGGTS